MMKPSKISVIVIAYNEEKNISDCLKTLSFADEIIVIDNESTDATASIAKKFTTHVYSAKRVGYVEPIRNFALQKATGDWILFVDADERIPDTLSMKLRDVAIADTCDAVYIPRKNIIFGEWIHHSGWWPDTILRFFKKGAITWPNEIHQQPTVSTHFETLEGVEAYAIVHYNYSSVSQYMQKLDAYTTIQASESKNRQEKIAPKDFIARPMSEFLSRFFAREGYKDGLHGLVLSILQAISEFILIVKVWELQKFKKHETILPMVISEIKRGKSELDYWTITTEIETQKNPLKKAVLKGKRKIR